MNWQEIIQTVITIIFSTAGISFVLKTIFEKSLENLSNRLTQNHQLTLDKGLEDKKASNERKNNVSKVRFDKAFEIYCELSRNYFLMQRNVLNVFPTIDNQYEEKDKEEERVRNSVIAAHNSICEAQNSLYSYAPFIEQLLFDKFEQILKICRGHISCFSIFTHKNYSETKCDYQMKNNKKIHEEKIEIESSFRDIANCIRDHLQNLEKEE